MDDDQTDVKQETAGEEASVEESSPEEPKAAEEVEETEAEATVEAEEPKTETEEVPKKGAQSRIRELNAKAKSAEEKAKSLEAQLAELTGSVERQGQQPPYQPQVEPGQEINIEQYKNDILRTADTLVNFRVKQAEAVTRINSEASQAIRQYPQLDPESEHFDKDLSDAVTEACEKESRIFTGQYDQSGKPVYSVNIDASIKKVVDKMMKPYKRAVAKEVGKATENIAKQVSQAALKPTSISRQEEKSDSELTIEELEKKYGVVY